MSMTDDYLADLKRELGDRLEQVATEREELERGLRDRLEPLREEESRLQAAIRALDA